MLNTSVKNIQAAAWINSRQQKRYNWLNKYDEPHISSRPSLQKPYLAALNPEYLECIWDEEA